MHKKPTTQGPQLQPSTEEAQSIPTSSLEPGARPVEALLHELEVHQIELEMQNEALRQAQIELEASRNRYVDLYDFAPVGYLTLTSDALIAVINLTCAELLGENRSKLLQRPFARFVTANDNDSWYRHFMRVVLQGEKLRFEVELKRVDGSKFQAQLDCLRIENAGTDPMVRIALTDVTERKRAEEDLRIAAITFELGEGMMVTDANGVILRVNQAFSNQTGYSAEEAVGNTPAFLHSGRHDKLFYQQMWHALLINKRWQGEVWNRNKNGKVYVEWLTINAVCEPDGRTTHYVGAFYDINQNIEAEAEIHRLAYYDPLTELPNRRLLQDRLEQVLTASDRNGSRGAILFLDLDNFKTLNDMYGHDAGDRLLVELAQRMRACVRACDTVARLGGDEFVLLLEDLSAEPEEAAAQAKQLGDKIQEAIAQPYLLDGHEYHGSTSIGICMFHDHGATAAELLRHADLALYRSKNEGRNTLRFFDPIMQLMQDRRNELLNDLRQACPLEQLRLYYQPQIDSTHGVIGVEALLRWEHPERGLVAPSEFIQLAEESGIILPISHWVLEKACSQIKAWEGNAATRNLTLSINASARQFRQSDFVADVRQVLKETGADPARLIIELTESLVLYHIADTQKKMAALKLLGIGFSLDDFGTGYTSLSYLAQLPLNQIKIDKAAVLNMPDSRNEEIITQTIITMARSLGLNIVAEGVETEEQRDFFGAHGSHAYQGFLFSRALPLEQFEQFLVHDSCGVIGSAGVTKVASPDRT